MKPNRRAFVTIVDHPSRAGWQLVRGGPSEPLLAAAAIAGAVVRWDRAAHGWAVQNGDAADLVAAGEHARLLTVRPS